MVVQALQLAECHKMRLPSTRELDKLVQALGRQEPKSRFSTDGKKGKGNKNGKQPSQSQPQKSQVSRNKTITCIIIIIVMHYAPAFRMKGKVSPWLYTFCPCLWTPPHLWCLHRVPVNNNFTSDNRRMIVGRCEC